MRLIYQSVPVAQYVSRPKKSFKIKKFKIKDWLGELVLSFRNLGTRQNIRVFQKKKGKRNTHCYDALLSRIVRTKKGPIPLMTKP